MLTWLGVSVLSATDMQLHMFLQERVCGPLRNLRQAQVMLLPGNLYKLFCVASGLMQPMAQF